MHALLKLTYSGLQVSHSNQRSTHSDVVSFQAAFDVVLNRHCCAHDDQDHHSWSEDGGNHIDTRLPPKSVSTNPYAFRIVLQLSWRASYLSASIMIHQRHTCGCAALDTTFMVYKSRQLFIPSGTWPEYCALGKQLLANCTTGD